MSRTDPTPAWRALVALAGLAVLALQMLAVLNPAMVEVNAEESSNAGQAVAGADGLWDVFLRLQYVDFCGGCSVDAFVGAGIFSVLPPTWLAWKLVPALWVMALSVLGASLLARSVGRPAALAFLLLMLAPFDAWQRLAVYGLGNHMECAVLSALVLLGLGAVPDWRRAAVAGLAGGLAVFVGYSAAFATGVGALWLFLTRRWLALLAWCGGVGLGLTALLYRSFLYRTHRIRTLYTPESFRPDPARWLGKLADLVDPVILLSLFGQGTEGAWGWGALSVAGVGAVLAWGVWRGPSLVRLLGLGLLAWVSAYSVVEFALEGAPWGVRVTPLDLRYAAPVLTLVMVAVAVVVGDLWSKGHRAVAGLALLTVGLPGVMTRWDAVSNTRPLAHYTGLHAVDEELWRDVFSERLTEDELDSVLREGSGSAETAAWTLGRRAVVSRILQPPAGHEVAWAEGLAKGHVDVAGGMPSETTRCTEALEADLIAAKVDTASRVAAHRRFWLYWFYSFGPPEVPPDGEPARQGLAWNQGLERGQAVGGCWGPVGADLVAAVTEHHLTSGTPSTPDWLEGLGHGVGVICGPDPVVVGVLNDGFPGAVHVARGFDAGVRRRWFVEPGWSGQP